MRAAILGDRIPVDLLNSMLDLEGNDELARRLDDLLDWLVADGWLRDVESWEEDVVVFEHGFVRDALIRRLGEHDSSRRLHECAAEALEAHHDDELDAVAREVARHWEAAGRPDRALPHQMTASLVAEQRYATSDAIESWRRCTELAGKAAVGDEAKEEAWRGLARALLRGADAKEAREAASLAGDSPESHEVRADVSDVLMSLPEAISEFRRAEEGYRKCGDQLGETRVRIKRAVAHTKNQEFELAESLLLPELECDDDELRANALNQLGMIAQLDGRHDDAVDYLEREERLRRAFGEDIALGRCLYTRGGLFYLDGRYERALDDYRMAVAILERTGHLVGFGHSLRMLAAMLQHLGRPEEGLPCVKRGISILERAGNARGAFTTRLVKVDILRDLGRHEEAIALARRCLSEHFGSKRYGYITLGEALVAAGRYDEAIDALLTERDLFYSDDRASFRYAILCRALGSAYGAKGDVQTARNYLQKALDVYASSGSEVNVKRVREALSELLSRDHGLVETDP